MKKTYNAVIVGYGSMGHWHYTNAISKSSRIKVYGIYDIDPARRELAANEGLPHVMSSLDEVLGNPEVDLIVCATPNNFHHDIVCAALEAGKNVISEKPVAMSSEELADMIETAKRTGKLFTVHQNRRADRDYLVMRETVESGKLGDVFSIESRVLGARGIPKGWRQYAVAGGGMMLDWGVHLIDQLVNMMKPAKVVSIYCNLYHVMYNECDDGFRLILKFENGITAMVEVGTSHFIQAPRWYVCGDRGSLVINDWNCSGRLVRAAEHTVTFEEEIVQTKAGPTKTMAPRHKNTVEETILNPDDYKNSDYVAYYENIAEVLDGTAEPRVKPEEAMRVLKIMEQAFLSHKTGNAIECKI